MASTCVNHIGISPDSFLESPSAKCKSYAWLAPRKSFTREYQEFEKCSGKHLAEEKKQQSEEPDLGDFEFLLEDNVTMLPADELFFDGKLVPLQLSMRKQEMVASEPGRSNVIPQSVKMSRNEISLMDPYLFSPKAPRCTKRWKEILGLRKLYPKEKENNMKPKSSTSSAAASLKNLFHKSSKPSSLDESINLPLLKHDNAYITVSSSRLSVSSSSSSGHEHEDGDTKPSSVHLPRVSIGNEQTRARKSTSSSVRGGRSGAAVTVAREVSMESPRMNASGKIVFQSLERSTSSPSSYGGARYKHSSVQRSYSANVRVTPVLNVPVCSKSGTVFGLFGSSSSQTSKGTHHNQGTKPRKDRN